MDRPQEVRFVDCRLHPVKLSHRKCYILRYVLRFNHVSRAEGGSALLTELRPFLVYHRAIEAYPELSLYFRTTAAAEHLLIFRHEIEREFRVCFNCPMI